MSAIGKQRGGEARGGLPDGWRAALLACVGLGLLGVLFAAIEASAVLRTLPPEKLLYPALEMLGLIVIPLSCRPAREQDDVDEATAVEEEQRE